MADFFQNGSITTIHNLKIRPLEGLEEELIDVSKHEPMTLIIPSLYSELQSPALENIIKEISKIRYLDEVVIGLDRANKTEYKHALNYFSRLPQTTTVIWNDGERMRAVNKKLKKLDLAPIERGKGSNVWYCFGYVLAKNRAAAIALHDADILSYDRGIVAKLFYPIMNPTFSFKFCKGYYYRATSRKLGGRVMRLLVTPLIRSLMQICRDQTYLNYLDSFRYPLAGEFAMYRDVIETIRIPNDWGLEIGVLSEIYRNYSLNRICQSSIADSYDHKHQKLSADDPNKGLSKMSTDIAKALFRKLATNGEVFNMDKFRTIKAMYHRTALDFIERYEADARVNGLILDRHLEEETVELFGRNIILAGEAFLKRATEIPFMPNWNRILSAAPDIFDTILSAVENDSKM